LWHNPVGIFRVPVSSWTRVVRPRDLIWLVLFGAVAVTSANPDPSQYLLLGLLALTQMIEPRIGWLSSVRGLVVWCIWKLALTYLLIGITGGVNSRYWLMLLLPVLSAATTAGGIATITFATLAGGAYLSFLLFVDFSVYALGSEEVEELVLRFVFLGMAGMLANSLAEALRVESAKNRRAAEQLAEANRQVVEAEEAVRRSDRLAALGQMSGGLAHELRNPLGTIKASAEMLARTVNSENEVAQEVAGFIATEVDRTNSLITRFLDFARPLRMQMEPTDLTETLDRAVAAAAREVPEVTIYKNYSPEIPPFAFDAQLLERVFLNLIVNAAQASEPGGTVTVKTRSAGGSVEIAVIDRGAGINPENLNAIFNPFFTTKPQGVGLGLAIVSKIVDQHGGKITVESEPGKGSVFRVVLPMARTASEVSA
jgi:two-component system sensor histidine kinase HydH